MFTRRHALRGASEYIRCSYQPCLAGRYDVGVGVGEGCGRGSAGKSPRAASQCLQFHTSEGDRVEMNKNRGAGGLTRVGVSMKVAML